MTPQPARRWWAILCLALLAPLLVVDVPPLLDYPNHLARAFVLASLPGDTILARFYQPHWSIIPNLALDLITPPLLHILPVYIAGRLLIATAILLPVLGTVAYNTALGGRTWSLGVGLVAYNDCLLYGFLNFEIALGLALLLAAAWLRWRETHPPRAIALAILGAPVLFACHLMGLIFFALLIGSAEFLRISRASIGRRTLALLLVFATPAALYALSDLQRLGGDATFLPMDKKLLQLVTTFVNYNWPLDVATAITAIALPVLGVLLRWGRVPGPAAIAIALLLVIFLAAPFGWKGTFLLDTRFAIMLGFMLFAGFVPANVPVPIRHTVTAALILLFAARLALLTTAWFQHRTDLADLRAAMAPIRPGQAIYVAETGLDEAPAYWHTNHRLLSNGIRTDEHLGALILIEHRAYWPFGFDNPSQQPIETREPYRTLANKIGSLPNRTTAATADVCGFDDVLLTGADAVPNLPPDRFRLLTSSGYAALYAITACKPTQ
jgi:predicted anti-sigma-YlaC factor YlaD